MNKHCTLLWEFSDEKVTNYTEGKLKSYNGNSCQINHFKPTKHPNHKTKNLLVVRIPVNSDYLAQLNVKMQFIRDKLSKEIQHKLIQFKLQAKLQVHKRNKLIDFLTWGFSFFIQLDISIHARGYLPQANNPSHSQAQQVFPDEIIAWNVQGFWINLNLEEIASMIIHQA